MDQFRAFSKEIPLKIITLMRCGFMGMTHNYITIIQPKLRDPPPEFQTAFHEMLQTVALGLGLLYKVPR